MRTILFVSVLIFTLQTASAANAQLAPPQDADIPIAFASAISDVCLDVATKNALSPQTSFILDRLPRPPAGLNGRYPRVPTWYRLKKKPDNIFFGVGDKPNVCHILLINSKDGRQSFSAVSTLLRAVGYSSAWAADGSALLVLTKKQAAGNSLILLTGLTDATDGVGPQVSVDVGTASDEHLRQLLGGK